MDEMPTSTVWTRHSSTFPRIRGGDPSMDTQSQTMNGFSPHTRG